MSKFELQINLDNDAFQPDPGFEVSRLLTRLLSHVQADAFEGLKRGSIRDGNGNRVGEWKFVEKGQE